MSARVIENKPYLRLIAIDREELTILSYTFSVDGKVIESACVELLRRQIVKK